MSTSSTVTIESGPRCDCTGECTSHKRRCKSVQYVVAKNPRTGDIIHRCDNPGTSHEHGLIQIWICERCAQAHKAATKRTR